MNNVSNDLQGWEHCKSGLLAKLSGQAKSARRRRQAMQASVAVFAVLIAVGVGVWSTGWWSGPREFYYGGVACHEVQENMSAMMAGTLPDELKARIEAHLRECPICKQMMQKMRAEKMTASGLHQHSVCDCPQCQQRYARAAVKTVPSIDGKEIVVAMSLPSPSYLASQ